MENRRPSFSKIPEHTVYRKNDDQTTLSLKQRGLKSTKRMKATKVCERHRPGITLGNSE